MKTPPLPLLFAELALASWTTIGHRWLMMVMGTCTQAEYMRMVTEKTAAAQRSALALATPWPMLDVATLIVPWHQGATANARRLQNRKH